MTTLQLEPNVLRWAAGNIGSSVEELARRVASESKVEKVTAGSMTPLQAEKFANLARVPFGLLFLKEPPRLEKPTLPDLRQLPKAAELSGSFYETLDDVLRKQEWFADYLEEVGADVPNFVGKFDPRASDVKVVAKDIAESIGCDDGLRRKSANKEEYFAALVRGLERIGVLVFKNGVVKNNGRRPLNLDEFRGFAIAHPRVPVIFINGKDATAAWIFTLLHEAAHIWFGESGISNFSASVGEKVKGVEQKCNQVAAEVLTPESEFRAAWKQWGGDAPFDNIPRMFKVSSLVVARRALDFNFIDQATYFSIWERTQRFEAKVEGEGGGDFYKSVAVRNSKSFTRAVVNEAFSGRMLFRDAGSLLNVSPHSVAELRSRRVGDIG